jgi:hypothetical protein
MTKRTGESFVKRAERGDKQKAKDTLIEELRNWRMEAMLLRGLILGRLRQELYTAEQPTDRWWIPVEEMKPLRDGEGFGFEIRHTTAGQTEVVTYYPGERKGE